MSIVYRTPESKEEFEEYFDFRWEALRKPIDLARGSEQDEFEDTAFHIAAFYSEIIIGVGRLHSEPNNTARIRYMAVDNSFQKQGIGSHMLKELEKFAAVKKIQICWLYARQETINFYQKNGYEIKGENKSELSEIKHKRMEKRLV